jgi:hypothetical protein
MLVIVSTLAGCQPDPAWSPPGHHDEPMVRTELYFGLNRPDGTQVSEEQWQTFVTEVVTPRFPEGLTIVPAAGQWQSGAVIHREPSRVLILLRPARRDEANARIEEIREAYKTRFNQDAVLRTDAPVHASF